VSTDSPGLSFTQLIQLIYEGKDNEELDRQVAILDSIIDGTSGPKANSGAAVHHSGEPAGDAGGDGDDPVLEPAERKPIGKQISVTTGSSIDLSVEPPPNSILVVQDREGELFTFKRSWMGHWSMMGGPIEWERLCYSFRDRGETPLLLMRGPEMPPF